MKPNQQRAKLTILFIWINFFVEMISLASSYFQFDVLTQLKNGVNYPDSFLDANDTRETFVTILLFTTRILSGIFFILWFRRAYGNLATKTSTKFNLNWTVACWFVPFVSLVMPFQLMKEMYVKGARVLKENRAKVSINSNSPYLIFWWIFFLLNRIIASVFNQLYSKEMTSIDHYINFTISDMIFTSLAIPLTFFTIKVVKDYAKIEPFIEHDEFLTHIDAESSSESGNWKIEDLLIK